MKAERFQFFRSYHESLELFDDGHYGRIVRALCEFAFNNVEPVFTDPQDISLWRLIRPIMEKSIKISNTRSKSGQEGGRNGKGVTRNAGNQHAATTYSAENSKTIANQKQNKSGIGIGIREECVSIRHTHSGLINNNIGDCCGTPIEGAPQPPSIDEIEKYISDNGLDIDSGEYFRYYQERGWKTGTGEPITDWQKSLHLWSQRRLKDQQQKDTASKRRDKGHDIGMNYEEDTPEEKKIKPRQRRERK